MSKVMFTIVMYVNKIVNMIETKPLCGFFFKLGRHVNHGERINPIGFGVTGQKSRSQWTYKEISL